MAYSACERKDPESRSRVPCLLQAYYCSQADALLYTTDRNTTGKRKEYVTILALAHAGVFCVTIWLAI